MSFESVKLPTVADFFQNYKWDGRPWLIVGMGPTFSLRNDFDLSSYNILGLNKVCREMKVDITQIIDFYILDRVKETIFENSKYLAMPYFPHFNCRPWMNMTVPNLLLRSELLARFHNSQRLLVFNLITCPLKEIKGSPFVHARYFSAEAAVSLLANLGVKDIKLLGVDGGRERAKEFEDHGPCDPRGFDLQWEGINRSVEQFNLNIQHLVRNPDGLHSCQETAINDFRKG